MLVRLLQPTRYCQWFSQWKPQEGLPMVTEEGCILEELNLQGLEEWPEAEQEQVRELLLK